ncbi:MAG TPA: 2-oxoacid:acceptor oxidoreductase family protein [Candidatus Margulisiibacteriota bacterium]|nr:2-oxoacid:acceptor oxidoreductase family protein [Candidatus Margulisiibacteriota bacterium]
MMVRHARFHGRGGEGVKLASRIVSRAAFIGGLNVQDSPLYGAERRGAPVVAFVRYSDGPIHERGYIEQPDLVVVMDDSLLSQPDAAVLDGLGDTSVVLVNTSAATADVKARFAITVHVVTLDVSAIALELLGHHLLSAPVAGLAVKVAGIAAWEDLAAAVRLELGELGLSAELIERNVSATQRAFNAAPMVQVFAARPRQRPVSTAPFNMPHLPARLAAPSITVAATSTLRHMEGWRVYRPEIDRAHCTRCFLCFALCPEGAIHLDAQNYPVVDYDHCKGCLVCVAECPPKVISQVREGHHAA